MLKSDLVYVQCKSCFFVHKIKKNYWNIMSMGTTTGMVECPRCDKEFEHSRVDVSSV